MTLSIVIGFGSIPIAILIKEIPEDLFNKISFLRSIYFNNSGRTERNQ